MDYMSTITFLFFQVLHVFDIFGPTTASVYKLWVYLWPAAALWRGNGHTNHNMIIPSSTKTLRHSMFLNNIHRCPLHLSHHALRDGQHSCMTIILFQLRHASHQVWNSIFATLETFVGVPLYAISWKTMMPRNYDSLPSTPA